MGYRSDVALAIKAKDDVALHLSASPSLHELFALSTKHIKQLLRGGSTPLDFHVYEWFDIKWYESDPSIAELSRLLEDLDDEAWGYIRLGEDPDDNEVQGDPGYFDMYINRTIEF